MLRPKYKKKDDKKLATKSVVNYTRGQKNVNNGACRQYGPFIKTMGDVGERQY